jgi:hypothetical protein
MGSTAGKAEDRMKHSAEEQLSLALKLRRHAWETGSDALKKAYQRATGHYMEKVAALEKVAPGYIRGVREECLERMRFLEHKMELMEKVWHDRLYGQYEEAVVQHEFAHDQAVALGWDPPRPETPEARHPCYKGSGLCQLAQNQPLSDCIYEPDSCPWRDQTRAATI